MDTVQGKVENDIVPVEEDLILELNFIPEWARKPPVPGYFDAPDEKTGRPDRRGRSDQHGRRGRSDGRGRMDRPDAARKPKEAISSERTFRRPDASRKPKEAVSSERTFRRPVRAVPERVPSLPLKVSFLPDQKRLAGVVRRISAARLSYPLVDLAYLFLTKPKSCHVKLEADDRSGLHLYQCKLCRMTASDSDVLVRHIVKDHLEDYFRKEEVIVDPPSGQFVCIARCRLSGILLGPPNHHSYAAKVNEVHGARYAHMSMEEYKKNIEMIHDPELIEKWKEESRKQIFYFSRKEADSEHRLKLADVEAFMLKDVVPALMQKERRVILPVETARKIEDMPLLRCVREAWAKESKTFITLSFALSGAFHHMDLYLFRAGRGSNFVSSTCPSPLNPDYVVDSIREVLTYLREHPGCSRVDLVKGIRSGVDMDSPEAGKVLAPLSWLVEKGHIIEFFNGALAVPIQGRPEKKKKKKRKKT